jgi:hypothetical protein
VQLGLQELVVDLEALVLHTRTQCNQINQ